MRRVGWGGRISPRSQQPCVFLKDWQLCNGGELKRHCGSVALSPAGYGMPLHAIPKMVLLHSRGHNKM